MTASLVLLVGCSQVRVEDQQEPELLLKNYRPESVYKVPETEVTRAAFPVIDMHSHPYAGSGEEIASWVRNMDRFGIEKTVLLTRLTGPSFDSVVNAYSAYPGRFDIWCGLDYTGYEEAGWEEYAIAELQRCYDRGAKGVGELGDKGLGLFYSRPTAAYGMHIDDRRMIPVLAKCAELGMPVNIHVADPIWMYLPIDSTNDGLNNAADWKVDLARPGILDHGELIGTLENALRLNPATTFIACHFANCSYDLKILGDLLDTYPNLYADISARYGETAPIPRYMKDFYTRYHDRLLYGTDMGYEEEMYESTFRILETLDEHFYYPDQYNYHWPLSGFGLTADVLRKVYRENALQIIDN